MGNLVFKISPLSFYQVNPVQTEKLYNIGVEAAKVTNDDVVFDLYCGIGTISLFMAQYAKKFMEWKLLNRLLKWQKENAKINGIDNVDFFAGDVEYVLDDLINGKK